MQRFTIETNFRLSPSRFRKLSTYGIPVANSEKIPINPKQQRPDITRTSRRIACEI